MSRSVLLVDDTQTVILFQKMMLQGMGLRIRSANDGEQALREVEKAPPDLVLLDIIMPKIDGIETCRRLKGDPKTKHIPVIMVTTKGDPTILDRAFQAGCDDYITKPLDRLELLSKVKAFLQ